MAEANFVDPRIDSARAGAPLVADQIEYMADMILEMHELAGNAGLSTLSGILALAHSEARQQINSRRKSAGDTGLTGGG